METSRARTIDGLQGLAALLGITFGVIPLARVLFGAGPGALSRWLLGQPAGPMAYLLPIIVVVIIVAVIAALEFVKRRGG